MLDEYGFENTKIVAADGSFAGISSAILSDEELADAVSIIGWGWISVITDCNKLAIHIYRAHYPGTYSDSDAMDTGKQLWSSEDYSTYNDEVGTGCWARVSSQ